MIRTTLILAAALVFLSLIAAAYAYLIAARFRGRHVLAQGTAFNAPWTAFDAALVFGLFLTMYLLAPAMAHAIVAPDGSDADPSRIIMLSLLFTYLFNVPTFILVFRFAEHDPRPFRALGFVSTPLWRSALTALAAYIAFLPLQFIFTTVASALWQTAFNTAPEHQKIAISFAHADWQLAVAFAVAGVIIAPFVEEVVFRGFVQRGLENSFGKAPAVAVTTLLFAGVHFQGTASIPIMLLPLSLLLSLLYMRTRNLKTNIIFHAIFNGSSLAVIVIGRLSGVDLTGPAQ
jgi:uncharacterized protein